MKTIKYLLLFFICFTSNIFCQETLKFDEAISIALEKNHRIQIARKNAQISENNVSIGKAGLLPKIDMGAGTNYTDSDLQTNAGPLNEASTFSSATLSASYTLFDGFSNINRYKKLQILGEIGSLQARNNIEITLYQVSNAYYNTALAFENFQIAQELTAISSERLERARLKSQYGQANTIQVLAAQVDLNSDSVTVTQAQLRWDEAKRNLNLLLNREVTLNFSVDSNVDFPDDIKLPDVKAIAEKQNAFYLLSKNLLNQSNYDLKIARSARIPRIDLSSSYVYNKTEPDFRIGLDGPNKVFRAGATINLNLFNGFQTNINIQNAKIDLENQQLAAEEAQLYLETDIINAFEDYQNSRYILQLEERNLKAAELNFSRTEELFNLGQVTNTQFREAQLNLIRAKNNISSAKYSAKLNEIELLRLSGRLINED